MMESIRDAFGKALVEAGREHSNVVAVSCDLKGATRLQPFFDAFPERSFEVGIAEANGIGISAGLALSGFRPFISSFAAFIAGRNVEIRTSIAYNRAPVVVVVVDVVVPAATVVVVEAGLVVVGVVSVESVAPAGSGPVATAAMTPAWRQRSRPT